ncbi:MAG: transposase [Chloroflexi bacterium]|nr:transposase [Chloroflexota bacterium]
MDRRGIPLTVFLTTANVPPDGTVFEQVLEGMEPIKRPGAGRPRSRPDKLHADKAYDWKRCRAYLRRRGIGCRIARKGIESSEKLGRHRWVVERTLGWPQHVHTAAADRVSPADRLAVAPRGRACACGWPQRPGQSPGCARPGVGRRRARPTAATRRRTP